MTKLNWIPFTLILSGACATLACGGDDGDGSDDSSTGGSSGDGDASGGGTGDGDASGGETGDGDGSGGAAGEAVDYTFDVNLEGFDVLFERTDTVERYSGGDTMSSSVKHTGAWGNPDTGAIELTAAIVANGDYVLVGNAFDAPLDMTGRSLVAQVRLQSGLNGTDLDCPGVLMAYARSGSSTGPIARGFPKDPAFEDWTQVTLNFDGIPDSAPGFDPTDVVEVGVYVGADVFCDPAPAWQLATLQIDGVSY